MGAGIGMPVIPPDFPISLEGCTMANNYLKLSFVLTPTGEEEALLDECHALSEELADIDEDDLAARYDAMSDAFKAAFPPPPDQSEEPDQPPPDPFASFLELFSDQDFPTFDCEYFGSAEVDGYLIAGTQADPHAIASLIQKCAPSVLPFGFEWSQDCDRLRPSEFGGGYYIITDDDIIGGSTSWLMRGQIDALKEPPITHTNSVTLKTVVNDPQALWDQTFKLFIRDHLPYKVFDPSEPTRLADELLDKFTALCGPRDHADPAACLRICFDPRDDIPGVELVKITAAAQDDPQSLDIETCLVLTTGHITQETAQKLDDWGSRGRLDVPLTIGKTPYGWFIPVSCADPDTLGGLPADLLAVMRFTLTRGCDHLLLDCDGPAVDGLDSYEW